MIINKNDLSKRVVEEQHKRAELLYRQINTKLEAEYDFAGSGLVIQFDLPRLAGATLSDIKEKASEAGWEIYHLNDGPNGETRLKFS